MNVSDHAALAHAVGGRWLQVPPPADAVTSVTIDSRDVTRGALFAALRGTRVDGHAYLADAADLGAAAVMVESAAPIDHTSLACGVLEVDDVRRALGALGAWYRRQLAVTLVVGITGSCGKTTTRRLLHGVLATAMTGTSAERSFNNDLGVPLTLCRAQRDDDYLLVEIGTNAPGEIGHLTDLAQPTVGILTGIAEAHLEGFGTVDRIIEEKTALLRGLAPDGVAIVFDDPRLDAACATLPEVIRYGERPGSTIRLTHWDARSRQLEVDGSAQFTLGVPGRHNAMNALAAIAAGRRFGLTDQQIATGLESVAPDGMRLSPIDRDGITFINDAYNANPASMRAGLATFAELSTDATRRILVLGDMLELGEAAPALHEALGTELASLDQRLPIDHVVYVGQYGDDVRSGARQLAARIEVVAPQDATQIDRVRRGFRVGDAVFVKGSRGLALERIIEPPCSTTC